jgi:hypothetical protein
MSYILGKCVEAGDDESGEPMMLIYTTREALMSYSVVYQDVAVMRANTLATIRAALELAAENALSAEVHGVTLAALKLIAP